MPLKKLGKPTGSNEQPAQNIWVAKPPKTLLSGPLPKELCCAVEYGPAGSGTVVPGVEGQQVSYLLLAHNTAEVPVEFLHRLGWK